MEKQEDPRSETGPESRSKGRKDSLRLFSRVDSKRLRNISHQCGSQHGWTGRVADVGEPQYVLSPKEGKAGDEPFTGSA